MFMSNAMAHVPMSPIGARAAAELDHITEGSRERDCQGSKEILWSDCRRCQGRRYEGQARKNFSKVVKLIDFDVDIHIDIH
jgi:hypothetical protein